MDCTTSFLCIGLDHDTFLYLCIVFTLLDIFFIVYAWTLQLFSQSVARQGQSESQYSGNPDGNNDSITGMVIILMTNIACTLWASFFYVQLLVPDQYLK